MRQTLLLTGFEPFLDVTLNPSGEVAQRLRGEVLPHRTGGVEIDSVVLPVSFARAPGAVAEAVARQGEGVLAVVSMGVHRGPEFRLETRAGTRYASVKPDNDGALGAAIELEGPPNLVTPFDLEACAEWLVEAGAATTTISEDAGGYLCERVFRAGLEVPDVPALFLHVPPVERVSVEAQVGVVRGFLERLVASQ